MVYEPDVISLGFSTHSSAVIYVFPSKASQNR